MNNFGSFATSFLSTFRSYLIVSKMDSRQQQTGMTNTSKLPLAFYFSLPTYRQFEVER